MSDEMQGDGAASRLDESDHERIEAVLRFWFRETTLKGYQQYQQWCSNIFYHAFIFSSGCKL